MIRHHLLFVFFHSQSPIRTINGPLILWIIINTFCALSQEFNGGRKFSREINRKRTIKILESTIIIKLIAKSQLEATPNYNQVVLNVELRTRLTPLMDHPQVLSTRLVFRFTLLSS